MKTQILLLVAAFAIVGASGWLAVQKLHGQTVSGSEKNKILYYTCPMHPDVHSDKPGKCPECGMNLVPVYATNSVASATEQNAGRKILYYQSAMHPWIKSDKPGKCPICGMDLVPVYEGENGLAMKMGVITLNSSSVTAINVQTEPAEKHSLVHTLRVGGAIEMDGHPTYFVFDVYEQDFIWLDVGQKVEVTIPALPDKTYTAKINWIDRQFLDPNRNDQTHGLQVRATLEENLSHVDGVKLWQPFDGFYAEGRVIVNSPPVLAIPRSAVLSAGSGPIVYVDRGGGNYQKTSVKLGRVGDDFVEVLDGLNEGDKVVTNGNLLIDSEAQLAAGE